MPSYDPYAVDGPTLVSFSGGRTSGYMLRGVLQRYRGRLPDDCVVAFENTGKERLETLDFVRDCGAYWNVPIHWLEYRDDEVGWVEVNYETASRRGEPFEALLTKKKYLPNWRTRFCTEELKIRVGKKFMQSLGHTYWTSLVGLRADEPHRVVRIRANNEAAHEVWDVECPLYDAGVTVEDVMAFWRHQPFDLQLRSHEGNCDLCFLKGMDKRVAVMRERPDLAAWWIEQERRLGATFRQKDRPDYATLFQRAREGVACPVDTDILPCSCTD